MKELVTEAKVENSDNVIKFVTNELEILDCSKKAIVQVSVAIDEIFSNIANYAYNPEVGTTTVRTEILKDPLRVVITFLDHGKPHDPLSNADPELCDSIKEQKVGGLGLFLVKNSMDEINYEYVDGHNVLTICKNLQ